MTTSPGERQARSSWPRRLLRRPGTRPALAALLTILALALLAPVLPLPQQGETHAERAGRGPSPSWQTADPQVLRFASEDRPTATAVRRALFGDGELVGLLGCDALGRDEAARLVWGARVSLLVGLAATLVSVVLGVAWGLAAGLLGGFWDRLMMRIVDALYAVPLLFVVILLVAVLRERAAELRAIGIDRTVLLLLVIGAVSWLTMARIVRGQVLALAEREFLTAARALGVGPVRLALRHVLPNLMGVVVVSLTLTVPRVMLLEAFLSFLGLGVEAPGVSWGTLAAEGLENLTPVSVSWWLVVFPGLALAITLGALGLLGDSLRDALDPRPSR
ncbi:MAG: ABC transporter permease [Planctomycetes bacterium]|nr:ABC transporter permease [Planctomycetota bacterium]